MFFSVESDRERGQNPHKGRVKIRGKQDESVKMLQCLNADRHDLDDDGRMFGRNSQRV